MRKAVVSILAIALIVLSASASARGTKLDELQPVHTYVDGQFPDVAADDWYTPYVIAAFEHGLAQGDGSGRFLPESDVRLSEAVVMAVRLHTVYRGGSDAQFDRTAGARWYDAYFDYAAAHGLLNGMGNLAREGGATRRQVALLLMNALPSEAFMTINVVDNGAIPDVGMSAPGAAAVYTLYRAGVLTGTPPINAFSGEDIISRAEATTVFVRAILPKLRQTVVLRGPKDQYVQDVLRLINEARTAAGAVPLSLDEGLLMAAAVRASEQQVISSHTRPNGTAYTTVLDETGVSFRYASELTAQGRNTPADAVADWQSDTEQHAALCDGRYTRVGIGYHLAASGTAYWVLLLCD